MSTKQPNVKLFHAALQDYLSYVGRTIRYEILLKAYIEYKEMNSNGMIYLLEDGNYEKTKVRQFVLDVMDDHLAEERFTKEDKNFENDRQRKQFCMLLFAILDGSIAKAFMNMLKDGRFTDINEFIGT